MLLGWLLLELRDRLLEVTELSKVKEELGGTVLDELLDTTTVGVVEEELRDDEKLSRGDVEDKFCDDETLTFSVEVLGRIEGGVVSPVPKVDDALRVGDSRVE
ncbi:hypothetical protein MMC28_011389 [Mycoblastus sanguinarius]|nr:hypothetical protein [Mycoblastus sanguinarius]